jgi:hypothetical protein
VVETRGVDFDEYFTGFEGRDGSLHDAHVIIRRLAHHRFEFVLQNEGFE